MISIFFLKNRYCININIFIIEKITHIYDYSFFYFYFHFYYYCGIYLIKEE